MKTFVITAVITDTTVEAVILTPSGQAERRSIINPDPRWQQSSDREMVAQAEQLILRMYPGTKGRLHGGYMEYFGSHGFGGEVAIIAVDAEI